jgi:hypothetical protein
MKIHWDALLGVFAVSLGSAVTVVGLVALALLGLSVRTAAADGPSVRLRLTRTAGAAVCLVLATAIVLVGLWVIVAK